MHIHFDSFHLKCCGCGANLRPFPTRRRHPPSQATGPFTETCAIRKRPNPGNARHRPEKTRRGAFSRKEEETKQTKKHRAPRGSMRTTTRSTLVNAMSNSSSKPATGMAWRWGRGRGRASRGSNQAPSEGKCTGRRAH